MKTEQQLFTAIILAADREADNPVAEAAGVLCKSLAPVDKAPMIFRVLDALSSSAKIEDKLLCGPPRAIIDQEPSLSDYLSSGKANWIKNQATPSLSAHESIHSLPKDNPVLLTTSDHALLTSEVVDYFCDKAQRSGCDVVIALARHETVMAAYPQTSRTGYRFRDGTFCSCNLFAFLTPKARTVPAFWRRIEQKRKNPLLVMSALGWGTVLRYLLGSLSLAEAMEKISDRLNCRAGAVVLPYPEAAIDVDSVQDWHLAQKVASKGGVL